MTDCYNSAPQRRQNLMSCKWQDRASTERTHARGDKQNVLPHIRNCSTKTSERPRCCSSMQCRSEPKIFGFHSKSSETIRLLAAPRRAQRVVSGASLAGYMYLCVTRVFRRRRHRSTELALPPSSPRALVQLAAGQQPAHYY
jgi:hypothetical protein